MIKIGDYNKLKVSRTVDFGAYLTTDKEDDPEILIPTRYIEGDVKPGDEIDVFVYRDSEDRLIATTEHPFVKVNEFAYLSVKDVSKVGAFLDWGLPKDLLCPFREMRAEMRKGGIYLVYVYLDNTTQRLVASAKIEKFLGNVLPHYKMGDVVEALVYAHEPGLGYKVIVDNLHYGMIYENQLFAPLELEHTVHALVSKVREDGKIDLVLGDKAKDRSKDLADRILDALNQTDNHQLELTDKSDPALIQAEFNCSKKDYKKALGLLYRQRKITLGDGFIQLVQE